jgi:hypothetical protein
MSAVIAFDFTEHLFQRLQRLPISMDVDAIRVNVETLITMCSAHDTFSVMPPSLVATACVLTTVRPLLDTLASSVPEGPSLPPTSMDHILDVVEKSTSLEKASTWLLKWLDQTVTAKRTIWQG